MTSYELAVLERIDLVVDRLDFLLVFVCLDLGAVFFRLAVLGKNNRDLW